MNKIIKNYTLQKVYKKITLKKFYSLPPVVSP